MPPVEAVGIPLRRTRPPAPPSLPPPDSAGRSQTGTSRPCARNMPANLVPSPEGQLAGAGQPGQRGQRGVLLVGEHPAHVGLLREPAPVRGRRRGQLRRSGRSSRSPAPATPSPPGRSTPRRARSRSRRARSPSSPSSPSMSCSRGPGRAAAARAPARPARPPARAAATARGRGSRRRTGCRAAGRGRSARPAWSAPARPAAAPWPSVISRSPYSATHFADESQRRGRRRHQLAQRDPVGLVRQALERAATKMSRTFALPPAVGADGRTMGTATLAHDRPA